MSEMGLLEEMRVPTGKLASFLSSLPSEKRVAMESVGLVLRRLEAGRKKKALDSVPKTIRYILSDYLSKQ